MVDWSEDTKQETLVRRMAGVLICRPNMGRPVAYLHVHGAHEISGDVLMLVRHLIVRQRPLDDYNRVTVEALVADGALMDSIVEFPKPWFRRLKPMKTVRLLMAERGLHGYVLPKDRQARIQVHWGRTYRVWYDGRPQHSFDSRLDAIVVKDRINSGAPAEAA